MKSKAWYVKWPGAVYAWGPLRYEEAISEAEVRTGLRETEGVKRLPAGVEIWPANNQVDISGGGEGQ